MKKRAGVDLDSAETRPIEDSRNIAPAATGQRFHFHSTFTKSCLTATLLFWALFSAIALGAMFHEERWLLLIPTGLVLLPFTWLSLVWTSLYLGHIEFHDDRSVDIVFWRRGRKWRIEFGSPRFLRTPIRGAAGELAITVIDDTSVLADRARSIILRTDSRRRPHGDDEQFVNKSCCERIVQAALARGCELEDNDRKGPSGLIAKTMELYWMDVVVMMPWLAALALLVRGCAELVSKLAG